MSSTGQQRRWVLPLFGGSRSNNNEERNEKSSNTTITTSIAFQDKVLLLQFRFVFRKFSAKSNKNFSAEFISKCQRNAFARDI